MAEPETADFVIVGGGTAGCVLAARLSACGRFQVVLIEAGPTDKNVWIHVPLGYGKLVGHQHLDWRHETVPQPQLNDRSIALPRGRVLGGSSAINGLLYVRGQREDFDAWEAAGNQGWGYRDLLPFFRKAEDQQRGGCEWHGSGGPMAISDPTEPHPLCDSFIKAASEMGIPPNPDFNGVSQAGAGYYQTTRLRRRRVSTASSYLGGAYRKPKLRVITQARVEKIILEGRRAVGICYSRGAQSQIIRARREIILAAGAVASPQLLMVSGIGDAGELKVAGVEPVIDLSGVGKSVQDHLNVRTAYRCARSGTLNDRLATLGGKISAGLSYLLLAKGPLTVAAGYAGCFYSTSDSSRPDMQAVLLTFRPDRSGKRLSPTPGFIVSAYQLRPKSRGTIRLNGPDPTSAPLIDPAYLTANEDVETTIAGLKRLQQIVAAPALAPFLEGEAEPPLRSDDQALLAHIRSFGSTGHHLVGGCRMGVDRAAVVDPRLRVYTVAGLRVVDGSIMPAITSGNTAAPIVAIAEKGSAMILQDAARG